MGTMEGLSSNSGFDNTCVMPITITHGRYRPPPPPPPPLPPPKSRAIFLPENVHILHDQYITECARAGGNLRLSQCHHAGTLVTLQTTMAPPGKKATAQGLKLLGSRCIPTIVRPAECRRYICWRKRVFYTSAIEHRTSL